MKCSICQCDIKAVGDWTQGHNAQPVNDGRCCDDCNATVVIPARLTQIMQVSRPVATNKDERKGEGMTCPACGAPSAPTKSPDDTPDWDAVVPLLNSSAELLAALKLLVFEAQALGWDCSHITPVIDRAEGRDE